MVVGWVARWDGGKRWHVWEQGSAVASEYVSTAVTWPSAVESGIKLKVLALGTAAANRTAEGRLTSTAAHLAISPCRAWRYELGPFGPSRYCLFE